MKKLSIFLVLILTVISFIDSKPQPQNVSERQLSFVIPAFGLVPGFGSSTNINPNTGSSSSSAGFANFLGGFGGGLSTRTLFRTVTTVTVATYRTCTLALPANAVPCGRRRRRDARESIAIEPTMVLIVGGSSITNQEQASRILGLPLKSHNDDELGLSNVTHAPVIATLPPDQDPTTLLYPTPSDVNNELVVDDEATTTNTPLADFWKEVNKEQLTEDEKARLGFGQSTTTVTVSMTGIAYTTVNSPIFTVSYAGCSPLSFPVTSSTCT